MNSAAAGGRMPPAANLQYDSGYEKVNTWIKSVVKGGQERRSLWENAFHHLRQKYINGINKEKYKNIAVVGDM